ncbi:anti-sigma factor [Ramlibacter ginsenosidimutans]|uniref:Anti-sigma factor n=1 Tax=Ramlibacter ginsenosidimutans TaxID=502333 RepID=A0A934TYK4_9BURK|nr:anti-sigma factor [Ramlibacter ginsenosidimutans]MBK6009451.1 anti-sigma factor [Ramlibacter ginsenosidimutans]
MRADQDARELHAYVDGEMELGAQLAFEQRLAADAQLREQAARLRQLSDAVRQHAPYHAAPPDLRRLARAPAASPRVRLGRWRPLVPALAFAALAAVVVDVGLLHGQDAQRERDELVASHVRAALTQRPIDVASSDQHTVKPWFATQLDFSPPVRVPPIAGVELLGGRVDYIDGRKVAVLVYREGKHTADHFLWPTGQSDSAPRFALQRGFRIAQWSAGGMAHRLVSDLNEQEFAQLVRACREEG